MWRKITMWAISIFSTLLKPSRGAWLMKWRTLAYRQCGLSSIPEPDAISGYHGLPLVQVFRRVFSPPGFRGFRSSTLRPIFIEQKFPKILRREQMGYKFLGKVSRTSNDCWISFSSNQKFVLESQIQQKFSKKLSRTCEFVPFSRSSGKCWSICRQKFSEMQLDRNFWFNGKGPNSPNTYIPDLDGRTLLNDFIRALPCCKV